MALSTDEATDQFMQLLEIRETEKTRLDKIHDYLRDEQPLTWLSSAVPAEVKEMGRIGRVNMLPHVVDSVTQNLYLDGYRVPTSLENVSAWEVWQRNRMDAKQIGIHRNACEYGASYMVIMPGDPVPVMRPVGARNMTVVYGDDEDWPVAALEKRPSDGEGVFRMMDATSTYIFEEEKQEHADTAKYEHVQTFDHSVGVCPVIRYLNTYDLDNEVTGEVEKLFRLQDQINVTTFGLLVAQHYGAFRQRYILGWIAETEQQKLQASASKLWTFEDHPSDVQVGEFSQTDPSGYLSSREATLRHLATVSQTPAHELLGQLVNLSAEALAAANDSHRRKITERQMVLGEAHEQSLFLVGQLMGEEPDHSAYVRWKDTEPRSLAQIADALGKMATQLGVPKEQLWELIPDVTQDQVERWKLAAAQEPTPQPNQTEVSEAPASV